MQRVLQIYDYEEPRKFLKSRFLELKSSHPYFSFQYCAKKLKSSEGYLKQIFSGRKKIGPNRVSSISSLFKLSPFEQEYFSLWILKDSVKEKNLSGYLAGALARLRRNHEFHPPFDKENEIPPFVLRNWLYGAILELMSFSDFQENEAWIRSKLIDGHQIEPRQILTALEDMLKAGILRRRADGALLLEPHQAFVSTGLEESSFAFYRGGLEKAHAVLGRAAAYAPNDFFTGTMAVDSNSLRDIQKLCAQFREQIAHISQSVRDPDDLILINNNFFSLVKTPAKDSPAGV